MTTNGAVLLKCCYGPDGGVRRIQVPSSDFDVARDVLASTYGKATHTFTIAYDDDEGERCSVTCQGEWDEARAISASAGKILKLFMTDVKPAQGTAEQHEERKHQHKQERERERERERQEKRDAKEAHKLAKQAQRDDERAQKQAHQAQKQAEKQHHKHMKHLQKQINRLQTTTETDSKLALDPSSPVLTHVIAPLDDLLALLSDPVFVMVCQQVVTVGLQSLLDSESSTRALDAMVDALSNSPLVSQAPVSSLVAHFRPMLQRLDDKLHHKLRIHKHLHTRSASRYVQVVQQCLQNTHLVPDSIPLIIDTLTDLRQQVLSTGDMEPIVKALTVLMKQTAVATACQQLHIDTNKLIRKIIKHACGPTQNHGHHHGLNGHGHGMGWKRLWGHHGHHGHHGHGHRYGHGTWAGWAKWSHPAPAPASAPSSARASAPLSVQAPVASSSSSTLLEVEPGMATGTIHAPASSLVHPSSIVCDGCNMSPIHGVRYKCTVCEDCELCEACEAQGIHPPQHTLIKIKTSHTGTATATTGAQQHPTSEWAGAAYPAPFGPPHPFGPPPPSFGPPSPFPFPFPHPYGAPPPSFHHGPPHGFPPPPPFHHGPHGHPHPPPPLAPPAGSDSFWGPRGHGHSARHWRSESDVSDMSQVSDMSNVSGSGSGSGSAACPPPPRAYLVRHCNYPDRSVVSPDTVFVKTWVLHNSGDASWPDTTRLIFKRGARELLTGPGVEFPVPLAAPGTDVDISAPLRTPSLPGRYTAYFRLVDTATQHPFGPKVWCDVQVAQPTETHDSDTHVLTVEQAAHASSSVSPSAPVPAPLLARESVYPIQMNALIGMGFTDSALNEAVLAQHGGNLQQTANHLLELLTKDKIGSQAN